jgi:hypothetical protein
MLSFDENEQRKSVVKQSQQIQNISHSTRENRPIQYGLEKNHSKRYTKVEFATIVNRFHIQIRVINRL